MKLFELIETLQSLVLRIGDCEVASIIFTPKDIEKYSDYSFHKDDENLIIAKLDSVLAFDEHIVELYYDTISHIITDVHNERLKNETDYKLYLELKKRFEKK